MHPLRAPDFSEKGTVIPIPEDFLARWENFLTAIKRTTTLTIMFVASRK